MKEVLIDRKADIALKTLPQSDRSRAIRFIRLLEDRPWKDFFLTPRVKKIAGQENLYIVRITKDLRLILQVQDDAAKVLDIVRHDRITKFFKSST